ncbi:MAG: hypothetical protein SPJ06_02350 [Bacilli bacterium]|nr:hypothetical protein [Bacilli bacterium]
MLETVNGCDNLIHLLKKSISEKKAIIHRYYQYKDDGLEEKQELEKLMFASCYNISTVSLETINDIIDSFSISNDEKKQLKENISTIMTILKLNNISGTTLVLDDSQINVLNKFTNYLHEYVVTRRDFATYENIDIEKITFLNDKYKSLATLLNNPKNKKFVSDISTLNILFDENNVSSDERRDILLSIIKYNKSLFNYKKKEDESSITKYGDLDIDKVRAIFKKYDYDFDSYSESFRNKVLGNGSFVRIREVLDSLSKYKFPKVLNEYTLMSLLLGSDKETISRCVGLATSNKLKVEQLLRIPGVLIKRENGTILSKRYNKFRIVGYDSDNYKDEVYIVGSFKDFEKNIYSLSKYGLSIKNVFNRCPLVLVIPNEILSDNLETFLEYGFTFKDRSNNLFDKAMPALLCNNLAEVIDQFIEIHPYGISYLRQNLSCIKTVSSCFDTMFYKIYYSIMMNGINEAFITVISNNKSFLCFKSLESEEYLNINDNNKAEITNTIIPEFTDRGKYMEIIKNTDLSIDFEIFDNEFIQNINVYSDKEEPLIYNFDGIRISKIKVLRIFNALLKNHVLANMDSFMFSVTYNTIINQNDYNRLADIIKKVI